MNTVQEIYKVIKDITEASSNLPVILDSNEIALDEAVRQGDVYLVRIKEVPSETDSWNETSNPKQLAEGEGDGSRHIVEGDVEIIKPKNYGKVVRTSVGFQSIGPVINADKRFVVTHPEHCNFDMPSGIYQVFYQVDAKTQRRVLD